MPLILFQRILQIRELPANGTIRAAFKVTESTVTSKGVIIIKYECTDGATIGIQGDPLSNELHCTSRAESLGAALAQRIATGCRHTSSNLYCLPAHSIS